MELSDSDRCPVTGRLFEVGFGALPKDQQSANFVRERDRAAGLPKEGERCPKTGRLYECGSGAHTRADGSIRTSVPRVSLATVASSQTGTLGDSVTDASGSALSRSSSR